MQLGSFVARAMCLGFGALMTTMSVNCISAEGAEESVVLEEEGDAVVSPTQTFSGFSSFNFYDGVPATSVKCNLDPKAFNMKVTAIRRDLFAQVGSSVCNKCAKVTSKTTGGGNGKTVTVRIIDESNDFTNNGGNRLLDMSAQAFEIIGDKNQGSIPVTFQIIDCPSSF